ncbi:hypothetical protein CAC42_4990 [Sphaceloma murrayae]|uniref:Uncharacterized protein n=1 Tax=Sphaceloma murrayae TaxID=2082308 RepID=A0A2K1QPI8_9PEZI|nr:hypothetical protein CAC42_4990 [Sphaceloma murrayae]
MERLVNNPYLIERILEYLDFTTLTTSARRVCKQWDNLIKESLSLRKTLYYLNDDVEGVYCVNASATFREPHADTCEIRKVGSDPIDTSLPRFLAYEHLHLKVLHPIIPDINMMHNSSFKIERYHHLWDHLQQISAGRPSSLANSLVCQPKATSMGLCVPNPFVSFTHGKKSVTIRDPYGITWRAIAKALGDIQRLDPVFSNTVVVHLEWNDGGRLMTYHKFNDLAFDSTSST